MGRSGTLRRARRDGEEMNHVQRAHAQRRSHEGTKARKRRFRTSCLRVFVVACSAWAVFSVRPAFAELDLSGMWANRLHEDFLSRAPGPRIGDYMGLPINDEGRARADAWQISIQTMPERQCILYTTQYLVMGPQSFKMLPEVDPTCALTRADTFTNIGSDWR